MNELHLINDQDLAEAVKYLVSGKDGDHLPYTDSSGSPNHRLMGAAWAALHGGYRGNKYEGANKQAAIAKLKAVYKSEKMDTPEESYCVTGGLFLEAPLKQSDSHDSLRSSLQSELLAHRNAGADLDCDGDNDGAEGGDYPYVMDTFPNHVVYSMGSKLFQAKHSKDADGDVHIDPNSVKPVEKAYVQSKESFSESFADFGLLEFAEASAAGQDGVYNVTVIRPGWSKNDRYYSEAMLKRDHKIFEGAKMFQNHQSDKEMKERPEGRVQDWVGVLKNVVYESGKGVRGQAVVFDPSFKQKLEQMRSAGVLNSMGTSIRALGTQEAGEAEGRKGKVVESLTAARSVDFVTFAGAGGQVEAN